MKKLILCSLLSLSLSACDNNNDSNSYPVSDVILESWASEAVESFYYSKNNKTLKIVMEGTKKDKAVFNNTEGSQIAATATSFIDDVMLKKMTSNQFYQEEPLKYIGSINSDGEYEVVTSHKSIPKKASLGSVGVMYTSSMYKDKTKKVLLGTNKTIWDLSEHTNMTAKLCLNSNYISKEKIEDNYVASYCSIINMKGKVMDKTYTIVLKNKESQDEKYVFTMK